MIIKITKDGYYKIECHNCMARFLVNCMEYNNDTMCPKCVKEYEELMKIQKKSPKRKINPLIEDMTSNYNKD